MSTTTIKHSDVVAVNAMVDALSLKLYRLERIAHLAAFATEARRVLNTIEELEDQVPSFKKTIQNAVIARHDWCEFEDVGASVMRDVANEISDVASELLKETSVFRILSSERYSSTGDLIQAVAA